MLIGCCLMWLASDIYWILGSRFMVGLGHGFCLGRIKQYISGICDGNVTIIMTKQLPLHVFFGVTVVVSFGSYLDFRPTTMILTIITAIIFFILLFLPRIPQINKTSSKFICSIQCNIMQTPFIQVLRNKNLRQKFLVFFILVLCQQYSGVAATIIYAQIIFEKFNVQNSKLCAIAYMLTYFFINVLGIFVTANYNKRYVLIFSSLGVSFVMIVEVIVSYSGINELYMTYISVTVIYLYLILHTLGLGNIPITLISDFFPYRFRNSIVLFFIMFHSMLALTITKIFQVIITLKYHISIPFCLFLCFSLTAFVVSYFNVIDNTENVQENKENLMKK